MEPSRSQVSLDLLIAESKSATGKAAFPGLQALIFDMDGVLCDCPTISRRGVGILLRLQNSRIR